MERIKQRMGECDHFYIFLHSANVCSDHFQTLVTLLVGRLDGETMYSLPILEKCSTIVLAIFRLLL